MTGRERRTRRRANRSPYPSAGITRHPLQLAAAILAIAMVLCMIASTCLQPF